MASIVRKLSKKLSKKKNKNKRRISVDSIGEFKGMHSELNQLLNLLNKHNITGHANDIRDNDKSHQDDATRARQAARIKSMSLRFSKRVSKKSVKGKIAFLFLLKDSVVHSNVWTKFFENVPSNRYNIYSHIKQKTDKIPKFISDKSIKTIPTEWCGESLVTAFSNMVKEAIKDPYNKYFVLLSGECIPLYTFDKIYKKIFSDDRSRINITMKHNKLGSFYSADQWIILNRKCADLFTEINKKYNYLSDKMEEIESNNCPDENYPIYYFLDSFSDKEFKDNIAFKQTTYTRWDKSAMHPFKFNSKNMNMKEICDSDSLFARKFFKTASNKIAMSC